MKIQRECPECNGELKKASFLYDMHSETGTVSGNFDGDFNGDFSAGSVGVGVGYSNHLGAGVGVSRTAGGFRGGFRGGLRASTSNGNRISRLCAPPQITEESYLYVANTIDHIIPEVKTNKRVYWVLFFIWFVAWFLLFIQAPVNNNRDTWVQLVAIFSLLISIGLSGPMYRQWFKKEHTPAITVYNEKCIVNPRYLEQVKAVEKYNKKWMCMRCGTFWIF